MATYVFDSFTIGGGSTSLSGHVGETGATWSLVFGSFADTFLFSDILFGNCTAGTFNAFYTPSGTPATADYQVTVTLNYGVPGGPALEVFGLCLRLIDINNLYNVQLASDNTWAISKTVAGVPTTLSSGSGLTYVNGDIWIARIVGSTITLFQNGTQVGTATDSSLTAIGKGGLQWYCATSGNSNFGLRDFTVEDPSTGLTAGTIAGTALASGTATIGSTNVTNGTNPYSIQWKTSTDGSSYSNAGSPQTGSTGPVTPKVLSSLTDGQPLYVKYTVTDNVSASVDSNTVVVVPHAAATQFYTDAAASSGDGSLSTPWSPDQASLYLNGNVLDGDRLSVKRNGTYTVNWHVSVFAGVTLTNGNGFAINRYSSGTDPVISAGNSYGVLLDEMQYTTVDGLAPTGSGVAGSGATTSTESGIKVTLAGAADLTNVNVTNCTVTGFGKYGILYAVADGATNKFLTPTVSANVVSSCCISGITLKHGTNGVNTYFDLRLTSPTVSGNIVFNVYGDGATNSGYGIQAVNWSGGAIYGNRIHDCGTASGTAPGGPAGIITAECDGVIIGKYGQKNEVYSQHTNDAYDGEGIDCDAGSRNCIVEHNYIHDCDGPAMMNWAGGAPFTASTANTYRFNVTQNNGRRSLTLGGGNPATFMSLTGNAAATNIKVYNNTDYSSNATGAELSSIFEDPTLANTGTQIRNNNLTIDGPGRDFGTVKAASALNPNRYYAPNGSFKITKGVTTYTSLAALQAAGSETNGTEGDPALKAIGTAGTDYQLGGDFSDLTQYDPTNSVSGGGGQNMLTVYGVDFGGKDFHGRTVPGPNGAYPLGAVALVTGGFRSRIAGGLVVAGN